MYIQQTIYKNQYKTALYNDKGCKSVEQLQWWAEKMYNYIKI